MAGRQHISVYIYSGAGLLLLLCTELLPLSTTFAATTQAAGAIRVSPALSSIQLSTAEQSTTIVATVTNLTSAPLAVDLSARDFGASTSNASQVSFYGAGYTPSTNPHSLQTSISFASPEITLSPRSTQKVTVTLSNLDKLAHGGHYSAILFSPRPSASINGNTKVSVRSAVASLIFLETANGGTQTLQLLPFSISRLQFSLPRTSYIVFQNAGNTQSAPVGQLSLYGPRGSLMSTTVVNPGSGLILPGSSRLFQVALPPVRTWFTWPGVYHLKLQYRDASQTSFTTVDKRFFYINLPLTALVIIIGALVLYLLTRYWKKLLRLFPLAWRLILHIKRLLPHKRQPPPPPPPPKPKRPRLIQG